MKHLEQLRAALKAASDARDTILAKMTAGTDVTEADTTRLAELNAEIKKIDGQIGAIEEAQASKAKTTRPADATTGDNAEERSAADDLNRGGVDAFQRRSVPAEVQVKLKWSERAGLIAMAAATRGFMIRDGQEVVPVLKILDNQGYGRFAKMVEDGQRKQQDFVQKILQAGNNVSGGYLTPDMMSNDIIELLYPETTFLQGNPRRVNMPNGVYSQPAGASSATAAYRKEGNRIINSEPTFKKIQMSVKFLGAIVPMTRQMLDFSIPGAREFIEQDLREVMALTMDAKAYFGDGTDGEPLGLINQPGIQVITPPLGGTAPSLAQIDAFVMAARMAFLGANITNVGAWRWVMSPRTVEFLATRRVGDASDGAFAFPSFQTDTPRLGGIPVLMSNQIPSNLGDTADETYIMLINFRDVLFGTQEGLMLATSNEASITINGTMVSAFENDLVFLRATSAHDIGVRRPISVVVIRGVRWGVQ